MGQEAEENLSNNEYSHEDQSSKDAEASQCESPSAEEPIWSVRECGRNQFMVFLNVQKGKKYAADECCSDWSNKNKQCFENMGTEKRVQATTDNERKYVKDALRELDKVIIEKRRRWRPYSENLEFLSDENIDIIANRGKGLECVDDLIDLCGWTIPMVDTYGPYILSCVRNALEEAKS